MPTFSRTLIWLLVLLLGTSFGAGLYESLVVVPMWRESPPETWVNTGTAFWAFVTGGPLTLVLLVSLFVAWRLRGAARPSAPRPSATSSPPWCRCSGRRE